MFIIESQYLMVINPTVELQKNLYKKYHAANCKSV